MNGRSVAGLAVLALAVWIPHAPAQSGGSGEDDTAFVSGVVVLDDAGTPAPAASVTFAGEGGNECPPDQVCALEADAAYIRYPYASYTTDADGRFHASLPAGPYTVIVEGAAYEATNQSVQLSRGRQDLVVGARAAPGFEHRLEGVVLSAATRNPVSGAGVSYHMRWDTGDGGIGEAWQYAATDPAGRFAFLSRAGVAVLSTHAEGYEPSERAVEVQGDVSEEILLGSARERIAILRGTVTDAATGAAVPGAELWAWPVHEESPPPAPEPKPMPAVEGDDGAASTVWYEPRGGHAVADRDGRYVMELAPGSYQLSASAPYDPAREYKPHAERITVVEGENQKDLRLLPLPPANVPFSGRVVDAETGEPVENAQVSVSNVEWGGWYSAATDATGAFQMRVRPGYSHIEVSWYPNIVYARDVVLTAEGQAAPTADAAADEPAVAVAPSPAILPPRQPSGPEYYPFATSIRFPAEGQLQRDFSLTPKPAPSIELKGYVIDTDTGRAVPDATVNLWNMDTGDWGSAQADADGSYRVLVRPGWHRINVEAAAHFPNVTTARIEADEVVVLVDGQRTLVRGDDGYRLDLYLTPGESYWGSCCVAYAEAERGAVAQASGAPPPGRPASAADTLEEADEAADATASSAPRAEAATYSGSGGGLGPLTPADADRQQAETPVAWLAALAAAGSVAGAMRRRR